MDPNDTPGNESIEKLAKREWIHTFIDPAVFWAMQIWTDIKFLGTNYSYNLNPTDFYNKFINPFFTKDLFYLDIRNSCDYSMNFYKDQDVSGNNFSYNFNNRNPNSALYNNSLYYSDFWPIKIFNIGINGNNNHLVLNIRFINQNFITPMIYIDYGIVPKSCKWENGFLNSNNLVLLNTPQEISIKFFESKTFQLISPCIRVSGVIHKLPWYSKVYYFDGEVNPNLNKFNKTPFDYLFGEINSNGVGGFLYNIQDTSTYYGNEVQSHYNNRKICVPRGFGVDIPFVAQTGVGLSLNSVLFYAKIITEQRAPISLITNSYIKHTNGESYSITHNGLNVVNTNQKAGCHYYTTYPGPNIKFLFKERSLKGETFQLLLTSNEIYNIQEVIKIKSNSNSPNPPMSSDLYENGNSLRFVFELFSRDKDDDGFYYGKAIARLKGIDYNGNELVISNLELPSGQMLIHTGDWKVFSTLEASGQLSGFANILEENPYPEFKTEKLVSILKDLRYGVNSLVFTDNVHEAITILRRQYYGRWDKSKGIFRSIGRVFNFEPFDYAIPSADVSISIPFESYLTKTEKVKEGLKYLYSQGNENSIRDNPSPYIIDPFNKRIDLGHLLFGLDGLIRDYYDTHPNYKILGFKSSNDFTGYNGDFPNAAAESRLYDHGQRDRFAQFHYPPTKDISRFYEINTPEADLLSDVDAFGIYNLYTYFTSPENVNSSALPLINGQRKLRMDFLFEYYYDSNFDINNQEKYPINANYQYRWLNFCRGFGKNGILVEEPSSIYVSNENSPGYVAFQGFIKKNSSTGKFDWVADQINGDGSDHQSKAKIRQRAEAFAHFWYQINYDKEAIAGVLLKGNYKDNRLHKKLPDLLKNKTPNNSIRFEIQSNLSLFSELSKYIEDTSSVIPSNVQTSSSELDYVINRFLGEVKAGFDAEKLLRGY